MNELFDTLSISITSQLTKVEKKTNGIYFTSNNIILPSIKFIKDYITKNNLIIKNILEPSCGSCQFINTIKDSLKYNMIYGIELNNIIFNNIKNIYNKNNKIKLINTDFLSFISDIRYDLIIGNPPYFVLYKPKPVKKPIDMTDKILTEKYTEYIKNKNKYKEEVLKYKEYYDGRVNIYIIFIIKSLELLNNNGLFAFVLPKNFLNCLYYNKLRKHINKNYKILNIIDHSSDKYIDTEQNTCMCILQKCKGDNSLYIYEKNENIVFNTLLNIKKIKEYYIDSKTLDELEFNVCVGKLVWNQHKPILTNDKTKTRLIYNSNIVNKKLEFVDFKDSNKLNFIDKPGQNGPILVVNRGYGKGEYKFSYCLIDIKEEYLIENHLICIQSKNKMNNVKLIKKYKKIIKSFENKKTEDFVKLYFENNAINTSELQYILPIY